MFFTELLRSPGAGLPAGAVPRRLALIAIAVIGFSSWINIATSVLGSRDLIGVIGPLLSVAGVLMCFRSWRVGLALSALAPVVSAALGRDPVGTGILAVVIALLLALRGASALLVGAVVFVFNLVAAVSYYGLTDFWGRLPSVVVIAAVVTAAIGAAVRSRSEVRDGQAQHERDAQLNRELTIENAVAEERIRIARDLHDGIGHGIAIISTHVGTAEVVTPAGELDTHAALRSARLAIQDVLEETQQTLRMLRIVNDAESTVPITHPGALAVLVRSIRDAGLAVDFSITEPVELLPPRISAAIYRIVQEILTNAQRHSTGSLILDVGRHGSILRIVSSNQIGTRGTTMGGGHGLIGMKERAESLGGTLEVRSTEQQFEVIASIPVPAGGRSQ